MSFLASPTFLRRVLWADAASCLASGAVQLAALEALPALLGLPRALLLESGLFLLAYALVVGWVATRPQPPRALVALFAIGNAGWAVGCALAVAWLAPTALGVAWVAMQAATVLVLADLQWLGLRRSAAGRETAHAA
ncbi:MAG TPA: hypothetical protein VFE82_18040 [Ramlibacter sp.]|jgi:hypothetical protein|uniref:hypothetical protein n=1 Tax=Ramlibacter sp. TaxID=1917967 RepID=UPI002D47700A|nr:hypothetical protein [Ramlibacter sp.]HZY20377.1 hypothetical protein [Ramlibacter sp.]